MFRTLLLLFVCVLVGCGGSNTSTSSSAPSSMTREQFKAKLADLGLKGTRGKCVAKDLYDAVGKPDNKVSEDPGWDSGQYTFIYTCSDGPIMFEAYEGPPGDGKDGPDEIHFHGYVTE